MYFKSENEENRVCHNFLKALSMQCLQVPQARGKSSKWFII